MRCCSTTQNRDVRCCSARSVDEFYLHQPDPATPLAESLATTDALVREGKITRVGMSNYHADEVARAFALCAEHGCDRAGGGDDGAAVPISRALAHPRGGGGVAPVSAPPLSARVLHFDGARAARTRSGARRRGRG